MVKRPNWDDDDVRQPAGWDWSMVGTQSGTRKLLEIVFVESIRRRGVESTRQLFKDFSRAPSPEEQKHIQKLEWLQRLNSMPKPNISQLARELLADEGIGRDSRKFQNSFDARVRQIRRAKNERDKIWAEFVALRLTTTPVAPAAKYQVVKTKRRDIRKRKLS